MPDNFHVFCEATSPTREFSFVSPSVRRRDSIRRSNQGSYSSREGSHATSKQQCRAFTLVIHFQDEQFLLNRNLGRG